MSVRQKHSVVIHVGDESINDWLEYSATADMMQPADGFNMRTGPVSREMYDLLTPDKPINIYVDDTPIMTGIIDEREVSVSRGGEQISVVGRDRGGRLVDESMPLMTLGGKTLYGTTRDIISPWFNEVLFSNAKNRRLSRGWRWRVDAPTFTGADSGPFKEIPTGDPAFIDVTVPDFLVGSRNITIPHPLAKVTREPIEGIDMGAQRKKKVEPGETRWQVLEYYLEKAKLLAWSTVDGESMILGRPNYEQEAQYRFFVPKVGSERLNEANVLSFRLTDSMTDRYRTIVAVGSGKGGSKNYGPRVTKHRAVATDSTDWTHQKTLIISDDDIKNKEFAQKRADREFAEREASKQIVELTVGGHSQRVGDYEIIYGFDTMCTFEHEGLGLFGDYLITSVTYNASRAGQTTDLTLVPKGTELTQ